MVIKRPPVCVALIRPLTTGNGDREAPIAWGMQRGRGFSGPLAKVAVYYTAHLAFRTIGFSLSLSYWETRAICTIPHLPAITDAARSCQPAHASALSLYKFRYTLCISCAILER